MTGLTWNRIKHDVKVDKMNEQHKVLFNILDALYKAMENKDDRKALVKIINDLITYSKQHLTEFKEDFRNNHFMLHFNMAIFLKTWISNHIEVLDKKYSQFLNDRGVF